MTRAIALDDFDGFPAPDRPPRALHDDDRVRPRRSTCRSCSRRRPSTAIFADVLAGARAHQPAPGRNREVRRTSPTSSTAAASSRTRRGPHPRAVAEGGDLRPEAGDERAGDRRRDDRQRSTPASTRSSSATSPTPTWSATPAASTPRSPRSKRSTPASVGSSTTLKSVGGTRRDHRRPRQRRADVGRRAQGAAHRAHLQPGAGDPLRRGLRRASRCATARCATSPRRCWRCWGFRSRRR